MDKKGQVKVPMEVQDANASFQVKNTFLEFGGLGDVDKAFKRRSCSDVPQDSRFSPLVVASKSPGCSPLLGPVDTAMHAVPIDDVDFELLEESAEGYFGAPPERTFDGHGAGRAPGELVAQANAGIGRDEPAYVVPTTPSPFLHSAFPPVSVPPFNSFGYGAAEMGFLPPAFETEGADLHLMSGMGLPMDFYGNGFDYAWQGWPVDPTGAQGADLQGMCGYDDSAVALRPADGADGRSPKRAIPGDSPTVDAEGAAAKGGGRRGRRRDEERRLAEASAAAGGGWDRGDGAGEAAEAEPQGAAATPARSAAPETQDSRRDATQSGGVDSQTLEVPENYTTVMLRNIPNKYTREMLIRQLNVGFQGMFDFMYLPIDFKNRCNVGYCFINFRTPEICAEFISQFHGVDVRQCLPGLNSKKVVEVTPARIQGRAENVRRLKNSPVMNQLQERPEWMPLLFGSKGEEEPFPMPDTALPPVKPRGRNRESRNADG